MIQGPAGHADRKEPAKFSGRAFFVDMTLSGIVVLFLGIVYSYIFNNNKAKWEDFHLPKIFWLSTLCILCVSFFFNRAYRAYLRDKSSRMKSNLIVTSVFAFLFVCCQITGWIQLSAQGFLLTSNPSVSYVYVLSGLHAAHVLAGIIFLAVAVYGAFYNTRDEVRSLLYFTDPAKKLRLKLLMHYWNTIDFLWIFLFLCFLYEHA